VAGEAKLDEPLAVEVLRHLFQNLDPPQVVLDQVVVGREDGGDFALRGEGGDVNLNILEGSFINDWRSCPTSNTFDCFSIS